MRKAAKQQKLDNDRPCVAGVLLQVQCGQLSWPWQNGRLRQRPVRPLPLSADRLSDSRCLRYECEGTRRTVGLKRARTPQVREDQEPRAPYMRRFRLQHWRDCPLLAAKRAVV